MIIKSAQFLQGIVPTSSPLEPTIPQVVLYGRSNAGKSSTVNCLTGNKKLARASDTPGRTKEANVFTINKSWYLIDMPGYGYAAASKNDRESIHGLITWFIRETETEQRKSVLIIDSKIGLTDSDREILTMLIEQGESITILMNKIDRLTQAKVSATTKKVRAEIPADITIIPFSAKTGKGIPALLDLIGN
ncbi:MAG: ribosome biogenesis GTP-binding protein YihA/YsxC [bacterium]